MHEDSIYTFICDVYECVKWGFMLKKEGKGSFVTIYIVFLLLTCNNQIKNR